MKVMFIYLQLITQTKKSPVKISKYFKPFKSARKSFHFLSQKAFAINFNLARIITGYVRLHIMGISTSVMNEKNF